MMGFDPGPHTLWLGALPLDQCDFDRLNDAYSCVGEILLQVADVLCCCVGDRNE